MNFLLFLMRRSLSALRVLLSITAFLAMFASFGWFLATYPAYGLILILVVGAAGWVYTCYLDYIDNNNKVMNDFKPISTYSYLRHRNKQLRRWCWAWAVLAALGWARVYFGA